MTKPGLALIGLVLSPAMLAQPGNPLFRADRPLFQVYRRIDFTRPSLPRFWQPGVCITLAGSGSGMPDCAQRRSTLGKTTTTSNWWWLAKPSGYNRQATDTI